jgi:hypothetical protein
VRNEKPLRMKLLVERDRVQQLNFADIRRCQYRSTLSSKLGTRRGIDEILDGRAGRIA